MSEIEKLRQDLQALNDEVYRNNFSAVQDFQKHSRFNARLRLPVYASAPSTCEVGEVYVNTSNGKAYVCSASNTWTIIGTQS